ncbi:dTDP-4-dehydrorhamnose 3,5-epimerase [Spirillospora sp. NBC_00431]
MKSRQLAVDGAIEFQPEVFSDDRGVFVSPFQESAFTEASGGPLFPVAQTNHSRSRRGVVRGLHFTRTPPGVAKYVYCPHGRTLDIVVDIRRGSPTFGHWETVLLDPTEFRSVYLPVGVAHAFVALEDHTVVSYMISGEYVKGDELAVAVLDAAFGLPIPEDIDPIMSGRDRAAPTLAEADASGLLPDYEESRRIERELRSRWTAR